MTTTFDESPQLLTSLEHAAAESVISWAHRRFGDGLVLTASMQDCVLIDIAVRVVPAIEVVFLDTGFHFDETLAYADEVRRRYALNLRVVRPEVPRADQWRVDPDGCCGARKVAPLGRALEGRQAWATGLRRAESPLRSSTPVVAWDERRGLLKLSPLASWSDAAVAAYQALHGLPVHPLSARGYPSIGCAPCTRAVAPGEDARAGRWAGTGKTECGLHG